MAQGQAAGATVPLHVHRPRSRHEAEHRIDREALARDLARSVAGEVRFDGGSRALYATDASNYRQLPLGVVVPRDAGDVGVAIDVIRRYGASVLGRGGGTSLGGQTCNDGVVLDFSKYMNRLVSIDAGARTARVEPGLVLDRLREAAAPDGLTFGPDPATHQYCTLGGMIGNNSCGVRSVMAEHYGPGATTAHSVDALDILLYDGTRMQVGGFDDAEYARVTALGGRPAEIYRALKQFQERHAETIRREFPDIPRRVSGYNLPALLPERGPSVARALVGSESTLALVLGATVRLVPAMPHRILVVAGYRDVFTAADRVPEVSSHGPVGLEGFDQGLVDDLRRSGLHREHLRLLPEGAGWLLVEFGGDTLEDARDRAQAFAEAVRASTDRPDVRVYESREDQKALWDIRESGLAATARIAGRHPAWPGWEDSAVAPERLGAYLRDLDALIREHGYHADLYGHFGQGCVHCRIDFELRTASGIANFRAFLERAADLVHRHGGSLSGEHGDGHARGELLPRMFGPAAMDAFREFKRIWDPHGRMNPGKLVDAYPLDTHLRLGTDYDPEPVDTWFKFPEDLGSFAHATLRCVGVGKCRKTDAGAMCPSYMVTGEEKHSTRGRAQLLFEMLEGEPLRTGWAADEVADALDLCLACKACKGECPVHVDMATYKAEFRAHYYRLRWRPRSAHAFGRIGTWARLAARLRAARLVNTIAATPGLRTLAKLAADVAPQRAIPAFAPETFRSWFLTRDAPPADGRPVVLLWPDTFNDHFHPETLQAATGVLEAAGFAVAIPKDPLCCGRPLYDFGMLDQAKARLRRIMEALATEIRDGVPIVGLEPSCVSVFRDELVNLFPGSEQGHRLKEQVVTLAELLDRHADRWPALKLERRAIVHGHCHQQALVHMDADTRVLTRAGVQHDLLDSGCCGMAGAFGFEREHYDVSMAAGERVLLPAVRRASRDTLVVADGFSCREQIAQATGRRALHLAQVLQMAMQTGPSGPSGDLPERDWVVDHSRARLHAWTLGAAGILAAGLIAAVMAGRRRRRVSPHHEPAPLF